MSDLVENLDCLFSHARAHVCGNVNTYLGKAIDFTVHKDDLGHYGCPSIKNIHSTNQVNLTNSCLNRELD